MRPSRATQVADGAGGFAVASALSKLRSHSDTLISEKPLCLVAHPKPPHSYTVHLKRAVYQVRS